MNNENQYLGRILSKILAGRVEGNEIYVFSPQRAT